MPGKRILWLCSWYPDRVQPYNGDFVQRHARAASLYNPVHVIHVTTDPGIQSKKEIVSTKNEQLTEQVIYFRKAAFFPRLVNFRLWRKYYKEAINNYIKEHGLPDLVHVHVPYRDGLMALYIKNKYDIPYLVTEHWTVYQPQNEVKYSRQSRLLKSIISLVIRNSAHLTPVSRNLGELLNWEVSAKKYSVIENVADIDLFNYKPKDGQGTFRFIHVSNMNYQKNAEGLISAFIEINKTNPATELVLVGPVSENIKKFVSALPVPIVLRGEISYAEVADELKKADAMVLFSRYENSPCSIIEALCCGLPVISTKVGGIPELITEKNGILVEEGDIGQLKAAMVEMVNNYSRFDRKEISDMATGRFSYRSVGEKLDEVYSQLIKNP